MRLLWSLYWEESSEWQHSPHGHHLWPLSRSVCLMIMPIWQWSSQLILDSRCGQWQSTCLACTESPPRWFDPQHDVKTKQGKRKSPIPECLRQFTVLECIGLVWDGMIIWECEFLFVVNLFVTFRRLGWAELLSYHYVQECTLGWL